MVSCVLYFSFTWIRYVLYGFSFSRYVIYPRINKVLIIITIIIIINISFNYQSSKGEKSS